MDTGSKYFDKIRINKGKKKTAQPNNGICQWEGCSKPGTHKAPLGRNNEGRYLMLCIDHVREYNKSYNYFSGLDDDAIASFQKDALTGHRPTWAMGTNNKGNSGVSSSHRPEKYVASSPRMRAQMARQGGRVTTSVRNRKLKALEKKALDVLGLPYSADDETIKAKYKLLVKQNHPDANGGDRSSEERLRQIIKSYKQLKQAGLCQ